jgi:hypothetical protein
MLKMLLAVCLTGLDKLQAASPPVSAALVVDLKRLAARTRAEIDDFAKPSY